MSQAAWLRTARDDAHDGGGDVIAVGGRWLISDAGRLDAALRRLALPEGRRPVRVDLDGLEALDTAGAWLLYRTVRDFRAAGGEAEFIGGRAEFLALIEQVAANDRSAEIETREVGGLVRILDRIGRATHEIAVEAVSFLGFLGRVLVVLGRSAVQPRRLRLTSIVYHMEQVGLNAVPIVGLLSFLIGVVLAYQGADQLRRFGADVFAVNLIAVSVLRELGVLLAAIIIGGRSGSAFTAQIGAMKVNEEVDAMITLGLDPIEVLVIPRLLALVVTLPLLGFYADMMGLLGGGVMSWIVLDISPVMFVERLNDAVTVGSFWVGIAKAPVFALLIAVVGCHEGLQVEGSAESVGRLTTRAVVESLFLVIIVDALFSIFFSAIGV